METAGYRRLSRFIYVGAAYFLACCRSIRCAGMVRHPRDHRWPSHHAHADGRPDALIGDHAVCRVGCSRAERQTSTERCSVTRSGTRFSTRDAPQPMAAGSSAARASRKRSLRQWATRYAAGVGNLTSTSFPRRTIISVAFTRCYASLLQWPPASRITPENWSKSSI